MCLCEYVCVCMCRYVCLCVHMCACRCVCGTHVCTYMCRSTLGQVATLWRPLTVASRPQDLGLPGQLKGEESTQNPCVLMALGPPPAVLPETWPTVLWHLPVLGEGCDFWCSPLISAQPLHCPELRTWPLSIPAYMALCPARVTEALQLGSPGLTSESAVARGPGGAATQSASGRRFP